MRDGSAGLAGSAVLKAGDDFATAADLAAERAIITNLAGGPVHTGVHGLLAAADAATHAALLELLNP